MEDLLMIPPELPETVMYSAYVHPDGAVDIQDDEAGVVVQTVKVNDPQDHDELDAVLAAAGWERLPPWEEEDSSCAVAPLER